MREILFRGKRVDNGEWVEGFYIQIMSFGNEYHCIFEAPNIDSFNDLNDYKVIPESVGQFTGLFDKNGKEIYEGDLVQHDAWDYPFEVIFNDEKARFVCKQKTTNSNNTLLSAAFLQSKGFKLVEESESPFENFKMDYFVKEGVLLFFNTPVTEWNENDFLVGCAEMRCGNYYAVAFRWIKEKKDLNEIYKAVKGKDLDSVG